MLVQSRIAVFFQWFVVPDVRKVGSLKRRVRRQLFRGQVKNGTRLWRKAHLQVKMHKTPHSRSHFGSCDVKKLHAAVARSTFASQNAQNTTIPDPFWTFRCSKMARRCGAKHICQSNAQNTTGAEPFWKLRCSKMARRCGAKHICKSKCGKHHTLGPLLVVPMSKNGTPLWGEAHLQGKMC